MKRLVEISSTVVLENQTGLPLDFCIFDTQGVYEQKAIQGNSKLAPIAFNNINKTLMLQMKSSVSQKVDLMKLRAYKDSRISIPFVCPKGNYNNLKLTMSQRKEVTVLAIKPALKIVNYCPEPLQYTIRFEDSEDSNIIFRNKPIEIYKHDPYIEKCNLEIALNDVFMATVSLNKMLQKKEPVDVKLECYEARQMHSQYDPEDENRKVYLEFFNDFANNTLIIYSKFNIFNETGYQLSFSSVKGSGLDRPRRAVENGNRTTIFLASRVHDAIIMRPNQKTLIKEPGAAFDNSSRGVFPRKLNYILNQTLKGVEGKGYFDLSTVIVPNVVEVAPNILTKTITILPKYVFINTTPYTLCTIQVDSNVIHKILPHQRQAIVWRSDSKKISFQVDETEDLNL